MLVRKFYYAVISAFLLAHSVPGAHNRLRDHRCQYRIYSGEQEEEQQEDQCYLVKLFPIVYYYTRTITHMNL